MNGTVNTTEDCSGGTANCVDKAVCSKCITAYGSVNANNHKTTENRAAVAATCTAVGYTAGVYCTACNKWVSGHAEVAAPGHNWDYAHATFNWNGYACPNATVTCTRDSSHTTTVNTTVTSAVTTAATCTATGVRTYTAKFTVNGTTYSDTKTETIPANGHTESSTWTTDANQHWKVCSVCGTITTAKANHTYGAWSTDTATCTAGGSHYRDCTVCGYRQTESTPQLNHSWGAPTYTWSADGKTCTATRVCARNSSHVETEEATVANGKITSEVKTAATCTTKGTTTYTAAFTNAAFARQTKDVQDIAVNPANHTNLTHTAAVGATCLAAGNIEYWYCSGCQKYFSNAAGTTEITQAQTIDPQKAHSYTGAVEDNGDGTHSFLCVNGCGQYGNTAACTYSAWEPKDEHTAQCACSVCHHGKEAAVTVDDVFLLEYQDSQLPVLTNDDPDKVLSLTVNNLDGAAKGTEGAYTVDTNGGKVTFRQNGLLNDKVSFTYTVALGEGTDKETYIGNVKVIPANSVYLEESFVTCAPEAKWTAASESVTKTLETAMRPDDAAVQMTDYPFAHDNGNSRTYSMGAAQTTNVKKGELNVTASFTFKGTGFDVFAVTSGATGSVLMKVMKGTQAVKSVVVNTYFGYDYGALYLDGDTVTLTETDQPLYFLPEDATEGFFLNGGRRGTTDITDERAYGWVAVKKGTDNALYQVPILGCTDLPYDTYTVTLSPRYSAAMDVSNRGSFDFCLDAVRVYDPIDPKEISKGSEVYQAYADARELSATYQKLRDVLIDAKTFNAGGADNPGVAFLETTGAGTAAVATYQDIGPKNEVYLGAGQAIAFNVATSSNVLPEKLSVGVKMAQGGEGAVYVGCGSNSGSLTVKGSTELFRDITGAVEWQQDATSGKYTTKSPIVIKNNSTEVISLTKLKWSYNEKLETAAVSDADAQSGASAPRMLKFSFSRSALNTLTLTEQENAVNNGVTLSADDVTVSWDKDTFELGETATLTITAPANFEKALLDGKEIAGYEELDNGLRRWTYTVTAEELGAVPADVTLEDANGYRTAAKSAPQLTATEPTVEAGDVTVAWDHEELTCGETALLTVTVPAKVVAVTVNGEELTQFTLLEDGNKQFVYAVAPAEAGAYQYTVTMEEGHGYVFDFGVTPLLTVNAPVVPETPDTPDDPATPDVPADDPAGENGASSQGGRWSFYDLLQAILNFFRKVVGFFKIKAR